MKKEVFKVWVHIEKYDIAADDYTDDPDPIAIDEEFDTWDQADAARDIMFDNYSKPKWSVLLGYPDYLDSAETYYAWVEAFTVEEAVTIARQNAVEANLGEGDDDHMSPDDFSVLLVTAGHIDAEMRKED
jgi:hypothetical protein